MDNTRTRFRMSATVSSIFCGLLLQACGSLEPYRQDPGVGLPPPEEGPIRETDQSLHTRQQMQKPAVLALIGKADESAANGNLDGAAANLERALRINPRDPVLWHKLAKVRLRQNRLPQAQDLAFKSNAVASDRSLQAANWRIIQSVRQQMGDVSGALEAKERAQRLE